MFEPGPHAKTNVVSVNDELLKLEGTLEDEEAKITFAKFLKSNPSFAASLLLGIDIYPFQHLMIKSMFEKDYGLYILSRGLSKTYSSAIFAALYAIFNPGVKIGIIAATFRQSKMIFKHMESFATSPQGKFFAQCIGKTGIRKSPDAWEMKIGNSLVSALPLGDGGRIRGYRFNLILIDEGLLLSENVFSEVIRPFLNVNIDPVKRQQYTEACDKLLAEGLITQEDVDKHSFPNQKLIVLSSASYTFEYLYKLVQDYESKILTPVEKTLTPSEKPSTISHALFQISYKLAPKGLLSEENILESKNTMSQAQFDREYNARFTDGSDSFFSIKKMRDATLLQGQGGTRIFGDPEKEYILAIDPNYSDSETSDHFAMAILELDNESRKATLVHGYALSKSNLTARAKYVKYILDKFNIVYIIVDNAGGDKFIKDLNEMPVFQEAGIQLKFFEEDFDNTDYLEGLRVAKKSYNKSNYSICHARTFTSDWIRFANEHLQACIEHKKVLFASDLLSEKEFDQQRHAKNIPIADLDFDDSEITEGDKLIDFIEHQSLIVKLTKTECGYIEVSTSPQGKQTFDLPTNLKRLTSPDRPRKDSYSALLLANYGAKCYWDLMDTQQRRQSFIPFTF